MRLFDVDITDRPDGLTASLSGEIDMSTVEDLESRLKPVTDGTPATVVLDMSAVTFLDSSGLRLILRLHRELAEREARLVVIPGGRRVSRVFELTGADDELEIASPGDVPGPEKTDAP